MMNQKPPRKQHTVAKMNHKRFANENHQVYVYDRKNNQFRTQGIDDTTVEDYFYTFTNKSGQKDSVIESKLFAEDVEKNADPIISKIVESSSLNLSEKERIDFCKYLAFQYLRTTSMKNSIDSVSTEFLKTFLASIPDEGLKRYTNQDQKKIEEIKQGLKDLFRGKLFIEQPKENFIKQMLVSFDDIFSVFLRLNWILLVSKEKDYFITSDNPVVVNSVKYGPYSSSLLDSEITFPISQHHCLYMYELGRINTCKQISKKEVKTINFRTIYNSDRYIISRKRKQLESLIKESNIKNIKRRPLIKINN